MLVNETAGNIVTTTSESVTHTATGPRILERYSWPTSIISITRHDISNNTKTNNKSLLQSSRRIYRFQQHRPNVNSRIVSNQYRNFNKTDNAWNDRHWLWRKLIFRVFLNVDIDGNESINCNYDIVDNWTSQCYVNFWRKCSVDRNEWLVVKHHPRVLSSGWLLLRGDSDGEIAINFSLKGAFQS